MSLNGRKKGERNMKKEFWEEKEDGLYNENDNYRDDDTEDCMLD